MSSQTSANPVDPAEEKKIKAQQDESKSKCSLRIGDRELKHLKVINLLHQKRVVIWITTCSAWKAQKMSMWEKFNQRNQISCISIACKFRQKYWIKKRIIRAREIIKKLQRLFMITHPNKIEMQTFSTDMNLKALTLTSKNKMDAARQPRRTLKASQAQSQLTYLSSKRSRWTRTFLGAI